jgi:TetR/AcrR family transcriptional regulator, mexJK operon transcriptional repressor
MMMRRGSARAGSGSGRKKGPRINEGKRAAILMAAQQLFASSGFDGAAMNAVAARAGVSKATVYAHFGNKERLFKRILGDRTQEMSERWDSLLDQEGSLHERLKSVAHVILDVSSSPAIRCVHRALTLPASLSPCNHDELWSSCFGRYDKVMRGILAREVANGTLEIKDVALASSQFFGLVGGEAIARALLLGDGVARTEGVDHAVDMFIRGNMPVRKTR